MSWRWRTARSTVSQNAVAMCRPGPVEPAGEVSARHRNRDRQDRMGGSTGGSAGRRITRRPFDGGRPGLLRGVGWQLCRGGCKTGDTLWHFDTGQEWRASPMTYVGQRTPVRGHRSRRQHPFFCSGGPIMNKARLEGTWIAGHFSGSADSPRWVWQPRPWLSDRKKANSRSPAFGWCRRGPSGPSPAYKPAPGSWSTGGVEVANPMSIYPEYKATRSLFQPDPGKLPRLHRRDHDR